MPTNIAINRLIYPYFVRGGINKEEKISLFPGVYRFSVDRLLRDIEKIRRLGINSILIFGIPERKDTQGRYACSSENIVAKTVREIKRRFYDITVITDVCLCAYLSHGHCGIIEGNPPGIDGKRTLSILSRIATIHAEAGADYVAPSAMAKHQVRAIRKGLDREGLKNVRIMGYSAKFASNFYGPFRGAMDSAPRFGDRRSYQLGFQDATAAIREIREDIAEGADIVMVKPALGYLDIVKEAKQKFDFSLAVYNVSGEYSMVKNGATKRLWDEREMVVEVLTAIKRAGADYIITYHAKDIAQWLKG